MPRRIHHRHHRPKCIEIPSASGVGVCLTPISHGDDRHPAGFIIGHEIAGDRWRCEGGVTIDDAHFEHKWSMTGSLEAGDLMISPSILCRAHPDFHAYVTAGRWTG